MRSLIAAALAALALLWPAPGAAQEGPARMEGIVFDAMNTPVAPINVPHSTATVCEEIKADPRFLALAGLLALDPLYYDASDPQNVKRGRITARCAGATSTMPIQP